jgi:PrtD family type I secretion system ABC transporter
MVALHGMAADRVAVSAGLTRFLRLAMQSLMLGLGAYLVIDLQTTMGAMFAASILLARALQPVELLTGAWRSVAAARSAFQRLRGLLRANPEPAERLALPRPAGRLDVEGVSYAPRGTQKPIIARVGFSLEAGQALGMVGPSGAGKSTLARLLVGVLPPAAGVVRLDGADITKWPRDTIGPWIGYLPQDVELFADTVANNISRFRAGDDQAVIAAAKAAGVHEAILALPEGYDTEIGEGGAVLSGGMRQRIGLARAVYGTPSLVVLDEPNSSLDFEGEAALTACLRELKARRTTVVIVSHRPSTLGIVDQVLVLKGGTVAAFGPREEVLRQFTRPARVATAEAS